MLTSLDRETEVKLESFSIKFIKYFIKNKNNNYLEINKILLNFDKLNKIVDKRFSSLEAVERLYITMYIYYNCHAENLVDNIINKDI